jgi:hypothetical protein
VLKLACCCSANNCFARYLLVVVAEARKAWEKEIPVGKMAEAPEIAPLALWLLSPLSRYVTGQTITHDSGVVKWGFLVANYLKAYFVFLLFNSYVKLKPA